jgi:quinol-cytochrome oxidoreductase complex cytochrome b subunit
MVTPAHIVPEWYFLPYYAILRSIPHKLGGVIAMFASILVLLLLPFLNTSQIRSSMFRPLYKKFFWLFILDWFVLGWIGGNNPETPYLEIGQVATAFYFIWVLILVPAIGWFETIAAEAQTSHKSSK